MSMATRPSSCCFKESTLDVAFCTYSMKIVPLPFSIEKAFILHCLRIGSYCGSDRGLGQSSRSPSVQWAELVLTVSHFFCNFNIRICFYLRHAVFYWRAEFLVLLHSHFRTLESNWVKSPLKASSSFRLWSFQRRLQLRLSIACLLPLYKVFVDIFLWKRGKHAPLQLNLNKIPITQYSSLSGRASYLLLLRH